MGAKKKTAAIEQWPLAKLVPYAKNARTHSPEQIEKISASIREYGFTNPILVDGNAGIIAGHGRLAAARLVGLKEVPVLQLAHLTDDQKRAYVIADNRLALDAGWDEDVLREELQALDAAGYDLALTGFDDAELDALLAGGGAEGLTDEDEVPEVPENPVAREGDVWVLGRHRIVCGDSTRADIVEKLLGPVKPHLMVTDPPYGVDYDPDWRNRADRANGKPYGARAVGRVDNDDRADWREAWALFPGDVAYCWHADRHASSVQASLEASGFEIRCQIVWAKPKFAISRGHYHWQHETCLYAVRKSGTGHWAGDHSQTTLWPIKHVKNETGHSTQKPVEAMRRPIENNSSPGQAVYDPFVGSGTTIIAAESTGRACYAIELNPAYVDVTIKRWEAYTGKSAHHEGDGRPFAEVAADRCPG